MTEGNRQDSPAGSKAASAIVHRPVRLTAVLALALAAGLAVWLATRSSGSRSESAPSTPHRAVSGPVSTGAKPVSVNTRGLQTLAGALTQPIYWAGKGAAGVMYELTREKDGRVFIRYLPAGVQPGSKRALRTIGTYPMQGAFAATAAVAAKSDSVKTHAAGNGVAFYSKRSPTNIYVAYPGSDFQVEVFDPSPAAARWIVSSGRLEPVPASGPALTSSTHPREVTLAQLKAFARSVGQPVYWAGVVAGTRYELTQVAGGRIYVRYLPSGAKVGADTAYLTVGTYPIVNALTRTLSHATQAGSVRVTAPAAAVAFYASQRPTNIYLAFPSVDYQIEVYDPSPVDALRRVSSGQIRPIG